MGNGSAKGYESRIHDEITSDIGTLYTDHYSILKELIQNADDAGANEFNVAFLHPSKRYSHPLLTGPLLLFVNDAKFTAENAHAIHQRRNSDKTTDGSKIGMFGLGLKSVFHLCQAFFYVSSPEVIAAAEVEKERKYRRSDILNPWGDERFRAWNDVSDNDLAVLREVSRSFVFGPSKDFFALFIPLRLRRHCIESETQNPKRFAFSTGDDAFFDNSVSSPPPMLFSDDVLSDLPRLMPLLSTLNRISFWTSNDSDLRIHIGSVERTPELHTDWRTMELGCVSQSGRVEVHFAAAGRTVTYNYGGIQQRMLSPDLEQVASRTSWPEIWPNDESAEAPVKVEIAQHSAVVFLDGNGPEPLRGFLDTVFLPLTRGKPQEIAVNAKRCSEVLLHAARFPNSARSKIDRLEEGRPEAEESVRQAWNRIIEQQGIYPLLIPALRVYADTRSSFPNSNSELKQLTQKLYEETLIAQPKWPICDQLTWCFCLSSDTFAWRAYGKHRPLIELPQFDNLQEETTVELLSIFPALKECSSKYTITISGYPRLTTGVAETPREFVADLLRSVTLNDVSGNVTRWKYLTTCIKTWKAALEQEARKLLVALAKQYFRTVELGDKANLDEIKALLDTLPEDLILPVSTNVPLSEVDRRLLESIGDVDDEIIATPKKLLERRYASKLTLEKVETLIKHLMDGSVRLTAESGVVDQQGGFDSLEVAQATESLALDIFSAGDTDVAKRRDRFDSLRLWNVCSVSLFEPACLKGLESLSSDNRLFKSGPDADATEYLKCLSDVAQSPVFLNSTTATALQKLGWLAEISCFDTMGFVAILQRRPSLCSDMATRAKSAGRLARSSPSMHLCHVHKVAIRYLLHGSKDDTDMTKPIFLDKSDGWSALASAVLRLKGEVWRVIPSVHADFEPSMLKKLMIDKCEAETVIRLLDYTADLKKIDCQQIVDDRAKLSQLLGDWPEKAFEELRSLKIFQRCDNRELISAEGHVLIQGHLSSRAGRVFKDYSFITDETGMLGLRKIVRSAKTEDLRNEALEQEKPQEHWEFILDCLRGAIDD